jgi:hypothetical protein
LETRNPVRYVLGPVGFWYAFATELIRYGVSWCSRSHHLIKTCGRDVREATDPVFEVWYGASFVGKYNFAAVDGVQALLPYLKSSEHLRITRIQLAIAIAVNRRDDSLHRYLHMAGIAVEQQD